MAWLSIAVGLALVLGGIAWGLVRRRFVASARRVVGRVVDATSSGAGEDETWTLTVSYPAADGSEAMLRQELATSVDPPRPGTEIGVLVSGEVARLDRAAETWMGPLTTVGAGGTLIAVGAILWITG